MVQLIQMTWFRTNIRAGSLLALMALAVQFALAFGHNHWPPTQTPPPSIVAALNGDAAVASGAQKLTTEQSPSKQDRDQQPADACAICAVMAMAQTLLLSPPPVLAPPQAVALHRDAARLADVVELAVIELPFQPRAPPLT